MQDPAQARKAAAAAIATATARKRLPAETAGAAADVGAGAAMGAAAGAIGVLVSPPVLGDREGARADVGPVEPAGVSALSQPVRVEREEEDMRFGGPRARSARVAMMHGLRSTAGADTAVACTVVHIMQQPLCVRLGHASSAPRRPFARLYACNRQQTLTSVLHRDSQVYALMLQGPLSL